MAELAEVIANVTSLQEQCETMVAEKERLQEAADTTAKRLQRAGKLTGGLASEGVRWGESVAQLQTQRHQLIGLEEYLHAAVEHGHAHERRLPRMLQEV